MVEIAIGARFRGDVTFNDFWISLLQNMAVGSRFIPAKGYSAEHGARTIFQKFMAEGNEEYLWMLDDDATMAPGTLQRLVSRGLPVVGALTWTRTFPPNPTVWRGYTGQSNGYPTWRTRVDEVMEWLQRPEVEAEVLAHQQEAALVLNYNPPDALHRTDEFGLHCTLIRRDVLEKIGEPYLQATPEGVREDFDFMERVAQAGFDIQVDFTVMAGHIKSHPIGPMDFAVWMRALMMDPGQLEAAEDKRDGKKV